MSFDAKLQRIKRVLKKCLFSTIAVLLMLLVLACVGEVFLRLVPAAAETPLSPYFRERDGSFYRMEYARTDEWDPLLTNAFRIAVIGDSFTYGGGVQLGDRFADKLELWLNLKPENRPVDVKVFTKSGLSTYQEIKYLDRALSSRVDLVMLVTCLNDLEDWNTGEHIKWRAEKSTTPPGGAMKHITEWSRLARWFYWRMEVLRTKGGFLRYYRRLYDPNYSGWQLFCDAAHTFKQKSDAQQVPLAVVVWPLLSHDLRKGHYPFTHCHEAIRRVWKGEQVPVLDLYDRFEGLDPIRMQVIPAQDAHPSEIAHRIAAEAMMEFIISQNYLPRAYDTPDMRQTDSQSLWLATRRLLLGADQQ